MYVFWALKIARLRCHYWSICHLARRMKNSKILFFRNRVENLIPIILSLFPLKNTQYWRFWTIFSEMVDFRMGHSWPHIRPSYDQNKIFHNIFFLVFHADFEKRIHFGVFSHPKMTIWGFLAKRLLRSINFPKII